MKLQVPWSILSVTDLVCSFFKNNFFINNFLHAYTPFACFYFGNCETLRWCIVSSLSERCAMKQGGGKPTLLVSVILTEEIWKLDSNFESFCSICYKI